MRVNSAFAFIVLSASATGCMVGVAPIVQYGPLTVELGPQGGAPVGPPTATPLPIAPELVAVVASAGQDTYSLIGYFPSDVYDYFLISASISVIGSAAVAQPVGTLARGGTTTSLILDTAKGVAPGRYLAQLNYTKGRLREFKPPAAPSWYDGSEAGVLSLPFEVGP